ncbi:UDP-N-acetylenolpyruvoylglucosamine reductase [Mycobacterium antarcticum]|uniref:UDP-N-acetylmuramate dehydrogenase n=1 Tax=unclassified Mycolicibacterium TaxID=2636767 RepID=UPI0023A473E3|nr:MULTISPECIES: UDP-N-acetylmuramate dehydrogenase [unclassified Mycolicibacterium]BDX34513.1 UDP-N-acetylenolpyruvoylglucosamine reductase [Mycolicibacterium sp. TUM20985]GLP81883.1 UDP-N-acetylenolpyruvoylglucosamine reductase [Mycolicibacterium sp. TUM20984]
MASSEIGGVAVEVSVPLSPLTTLRIGPVSRRFVTCDTTEKVVDVLRELPADDPAERTLILGGGSNVVIADDLHDLTVVRVANTEITVSDDVVRAEAGASWDDVVVTSLAYGLGGLECLSGIPGSTGATPVQNVGAYGVEVADVIKRVRLLDRRTGEVRWVAPDELGFGYRTSVLKNSSRAVVLEVEFALDPSDRSAPIRYGELARALGVEPGSQAEPTRVREAVLALRTRKGMVLAEGDPDTWSVGSFFTNPVVSAAEFERLRADVEGPVPNYPAPEGVKLAAGWLVEHAGFGRGYPGDGAAARLSTKHALALTNRGSATAEDLLSLARTVRDGVRRTFGIELTPEPILVGCAL